MYVCMYLFILSVSQSGRVRERFEVRGLNLNRRMEFLLVLHPTPLRSATRYSKCTRYIGRTRCTYMVYAVLYTSHPATPSDPLLFVDVISRDFPGVYMCKVYNELRMYQYLDNRAMHSL